MTPWTEDRLTRAAQFGEWGALERLHEAFAASRATEELHQAPHTPPEGARTEPGTSSPAL